MKMVTTKNLRLHPKAGIVPAMSPEQLKDFVLDIKHRGIKVPIEVIQGNIAIDGRSRLQAARKLKLSAVPVVMVELNDELPELYILRSATQRRHLTADQLACLALEEMEILAAISRKERARKAGASNSKKRATENSADDVAAKSSDRSNDARTQVAIRYGVSDRQVRHAKRLKELSKPLFKQAKLGLTRMGEATRDAERSVRKQELVRQLKAAKKKSRGKADWEIRCGDCLAELKNVKTGSVQLVFTDPPYNIGVDYGRGKKADLLPRSKYLSWCEKWIKECACVLASNGSLWVMINDEYADGLGVILRNSGLPRRAWIKWYETFGVNCQQNFNRCSGHIFYHVKDSSNFHLPSRGNHSAFRSFAPLPGQTGLKGR